jgi:hypothetical protein
LVASGTLRSGIYRWDVPDAKFIPKWDLRTESLRGTVSLAVSNDKQPFVTVGSMGTANDLEETFDGFETKIFEAEARLTLTRSASDAKVGPVVTRWMARAYAAPLRARIFSVPLLLHHVVTPSNGKDYFVNVDDELDRLRDLVDNPRVVTYQEGNRTYSVIVEDVRWRPVHSYDAHYSWDWDGTCLLIMRSVR